jgi:membrane associated rhomboid family serine protease
MEERLLLWVYLISAVSIAAIFRRRTDLDRWYLGVVLLIGAVSAAGLAFPGSRRPAFLAATTGFILFLLLPGILVRVARRGAVHGRFGGARALLRVAAALLPSSALRAERDLYTAIHTSGGPEHPEAARLRYRLGALRGGGRARACATIALLLLAAYGAVSLLGDPESHLTLMELGANHGRLVREGQWYRLFTMLFLHMGLLHLAMNVCGVWLLGRWVEPRLGPAWTVLVFLLSGLVGSVASIVAYGSDVSSVGASGAVMGLVGAATAIRLPRTSGDAQRRRQLMALLMVIGATLFLGVVERLIDNGAHIGGLAAGFLLGLLSLRAPRIPRLAPRAAAGVLAAAGLVSVAWMIRDLPSWRATVRVAGNGFALDRPAYMVPAGEGPVWSFLFLGTPTGEFRVCVQPETDDLEGFLAGLLSEIAGEARGLEPRPRIEVTGPHRPPGPDGPALAGRVVVTAESGGERTEVFVFREPGTRIAVLTFRLPESDTVLRERTVPGVLESFRFR